MDAIEIAHMIESLERVRDFIDGIHTTGRTEKVAELNRLIAKLRLSIGA